VKRLIALLLIICVSSVSANPFFPLIMGRTAAATCSNLIIEYAGARHSDNIVGDANRRYVAIKFVNTNSVTICRADMPLYKLGSPTHNLVASIWSHNAGTDEPDAQIAGTESASIASSSLGTTDPSGGTWSSFTGMSFALSASTTYWLMIEVSAAGDASNHVLWTRVVTTGRIARDDTGVTPWSIDSASRTTMYRLFSN
jgi:hypothetical protein